MPPKPDKKRRSHMTEVALTSIYDTQPIVTAGSTVELQSDPAAKALPWSADSTPEEIGRSAVQAVQSIQERKDQLQQELAALRTQEQVIVLAAKDAGNFSWNALARVFGRTKNSMVNTYDEKGKAAIRRHNDRVRQAGRKALQEAS